MKIAILGGSPIALEACLRFHLHGAALTWYKDQKDFKQFSSANHAPMAFTSDLGLGVLKELNLHYAPKSFSWIEWQESYARPLNDYLSAQQETKSDELISVSKRFLASGETIPGRSRFLDLFRLIYQVNPRDFIEDQKESNPEAYQRMTDEMVHSLASTIEMYQDYDLVLDMRSNLSQASIGASGRALGERRKTDKISYALDALDFSKKLKPSPEVRELCLVGSNSLAAEILLSLKDWIKEERSRLFIVTTEEVPFEHFLSHAEKETAQKLNELFEEIETEFEQEIETFTVKLREWQQLDDFVQVKVPRPAEPIPRVNYFSGHNVTAIDELIDKKRMFMTLEKPEFRSGKKHPDNNLLELKTIGVDHILVGHSKKDLSVLGIDKDEIGFFDLTPTLPNIKEGWEHDLNLLEGIEDEIFKLFSPANPH